MANVGDQLVMSPYYHHWQEATDRLAAGLKSRDRERQRRRAAIAHALSFTTWYSLTCHQGHDDDDAVELALRLLP